MSNLALGPHVPCLMCAEQMQVAIDEHFTLLMACSQEYAVHPASVCVCVSVWVCGCARGCMYTHQMWRQVSKEALNETILYPSA